MASKTQIANKTLVKLGQDRVSNIETDNSQRAIIINQLWDVVRDATLQTYPWNFAIKRISLAPDSVAPAWGWAAAYSLPSDCLQLIEIKDQIDYELEGGKILCDESNVIYIKYVYKVTDASLYPPSFVDVFSHDLATEACEAITSDANLKQLLIAERRMIVDRALAADSVENLPVDIVEDDWLTART